MRQKCYPPTQAGVLYTIWRLFIVRRHKRRSAYRCRRLTVTAIDAIRRQLDDMGYFFERGWALDQLTDTLRNFGRIKQVDQIHPQDNSSLFIRSKKPIPVHNEDPDVKWLAWFCERSASDGGRTILVDGDKLISAISRPTITALRSVVCSHRNPLFEPILSESGKWYLIPWSLPKSLEREESAALEDLRSAIGKQPSITIDLKRGDILIVKNRRILHGREGFSDSSRKLIRVMAMEQPRSTI